LNFAPSLFIHELHGPIKGVLFCVEGANEATLKLLAKIGHVRVEGGYYVDLDVSLLNYCKWSQMVSDHRTAGGNDLRSLRA